MARYFLLIRNANRNNGINAYPSARERGMNEIIMADAIYLSSKKR